MKRILILVATVATLAVISGGGIPSMSMLSPRRASIFASGRAPTIPPATS